MSSTRVPVIEDGSSAAIFNQNISPNTDFFSGGEVKRSDGYHPVKHSIMVCLSLDGTITVFKNNDDPVATDIPMILYANTQLTRDCLYAFDILLSPGQTYNIQHSAAANCDITCEIFESDLTSIG